MSRLIKSFPGWADSTVGGIFKALSTQTDATTDFPFLENAALLDVEYIGNRSGDKTVAPLLDKFIEQNAEETDPFAMTAAQKNTLASIILNKFRNKWTRLQAVEEAEYNPIENYSMTEEETPDISRKRKASNDYEELDVTSIDREISRKRKASNDYAETDVRTIDKDVTRTERATDDYSETDTTSVDTDTTVTTTSETASDVYGFNSASPVPTGDTNGGSNARTTGSGEDNKTVVEREKIGGMVINETADGQDNQETTTHTQAGYIEETESADGDDNKETKSHTQTGYLEETESGKRTLTRSGNIGVTTSQQMIQSEIDLWSWNFIESVFADVDSVLTIQVYDIFERGRYR